MMVYLNRLADALRHGRWPTLLGAAELGRLSGLPRPLAWLWLLYLLTPELSGYRGAAYGRAVLRDDFEAWLRSRARIAWRGPLA